MKRFLAFYGDHYYAQGGMSDCIGKFDTIEEAIESIKTKHSKEGSSAELGDFTWAQVWDLELDEQVFGI